MEFIELRCPNCHRLAMKIRVNGQNLLGVIEHKCQGSKCKRINTYILQDELNAYSLKKSLKLISKKPNNRHLQRLLSLISIASSRTLKQ